jgi:hypothetical protein
MATEEAFPNLNGTARSDCYGKLSITVWSGRLSDPLASFRHDLSTETTQQFRSLSSSYLGGVLGHEQPLTVLPCTVRLQRDNSRSLGRTPNYDS